MKFLLVFLVMFMVIAVNLEDGMLSAIGLDADIMKGALAAWIITGLTIYHRLALVVITLVLCTGANLPQQTLDAWGLDRTVLITTLIVFVMTPKLKQWLEG